MIESPLPNLRAWAETLAKLEIPVLPGTVAELSQLREIEENNGNVDAHTLAEGFSNDPLMTLKVLVQVSKHCTRLSVEPPETLVGAIVMQGISPFFHTFQDIRTILDWLRDRPEALSGLIKVITRARRSAHFAMNFALRRQDQDAVVIQEAALLHDFAEMLLWCHAPDLALEIANRLKTDHTQRSQVVQREVLGITLDDLGHELMRLWNLPELLIECTDGHKMNDPRVRSVILGVQIARHTQHGWDDPHAEMALPADIKDVAQLLTLSYDAAQRLVMSIDG